MDTATARTRVFAILDADDNLREAALALLGSGKVDPRSLSDLLQKRVAGAFSIDGVPIVLPIGSSKGLDGPEAYRSLGVDRSERFIVVGSLPRDPSGVPGRIGDAEIFHDPPIGPLRVSGNSRAVGNAADVRTALGTAALHGNDLDGRDVAVAVVDTGIYLDHLKKVASRDFGATPVTDAAASWTPPIVATPPFQHRKGHGTMTAYDVLVAAPRATLLDYPALLGRLDHSSLGTLSVMMAAYSQLLFDWVTSPSPKLRNRYKALVITNSWGIYHPSLDQPRGTLDRFIDNPAHAFRGIVQALTLAGADIVFSAGNCGPECPAASCLSRTTGTINGGAAYPEVLTVGGCTVQDEMTGYSSCGPAIDGMPQPEKPDLAAYTHFLGSEAAARKHPDTGTSASCPVAAGAIAALRTRQSFNTTPPAAMIQTLRTTARKIGAPGWTPDVGHGIINPVGAAQALGLIA